MCGYSGVTRVTEVSHTETSHRIMCSIDFRMTQIRARRALARIYARLHLQSTQQNVQRTPPAVRRADLLTPLPHTLQRACPA
jgi:hypothetical protein